MRKELLKSDEIGVLEILKSNSNSGKADAQCRFQLDWPDIMDKANELTMENSNKINKMLEQYDNRPPGYNNDFMFGSNVFNKGNTGYGVRTKGQYGYIKNN